MAKLPAFWKILFATGAVGLVIVGIECFFGVKPDRYFLGLVLLIFEIAVGFDCVVDAILRKDKPDLA